MENDFFVQCAALIEFLINWIIANPYCSVPVIVLIAAAGIITRNKPPEGSTEYGIAAVSSFGAGILLATYVAWLLTLRSRWPFPFELTMWVIGAGVSWGIAYLLSMLARGPARFLVGMYYGLSSVASFGQYVAQYGSANLPGTPQVGAVLPETVVPATLTETVVGAASELIPTSVAFGVPQHTWMQETAGMPPDVSAQAELMSFVGASD